MSQRRLHDAALDALLAGEPDRKGGLVTALRAAWAQGSVAISGEPAVAVPIPGRPEHPLLVPPRQLPRRRLNTAEGRAALVHAVAHIEFNAINLALDAVYRFRELPADYYGDWLRVAEDEWRHFRLLRDRLNEIGHDYGDFPAHNGLWEMALETAHALLPRMALVPRVLEARGLDVTPGMLERLRAAGDDATCACLTVILREEEAHVAIGTRWFHYACELEGLEPEATFRALLGEYMLGPVRGPFNTAARRRAGFSESEMLWLESQDPGA